MTINFKSRLVNDGTYEKVGGAVAFSAPQTISGNSKQTAASLIFESFATNPKASFLTPIHQWPLDATTARREDAKPVPCLVLERTRNSKRRRRKD